MGEKTIQNARKWFALICAIFLYYLIHEGSHVIVALLYGVFEQIRILGVGVQVVANVERLTDIQTGIFCIVGSIATLFTAYIGVLFLPRITASKSKIFRAIGYYTTLAFLLLDPIYLSFLYRFVGGGDMNGILLFEIPEAVVQLIYGVIALVNLFLIVRKVYPAYRESFRSH